MSGLFLFIHILLSVVFYPGRQGIAETIRTKSFEYHFKIRQEVSFMIDKLGSQHIGMPIQRSVHHQSDIKETAPATDIFQKGETISKETVPQAGIPVSEAVSHKEREIKTDKNGLPLLNTPKKAVKTLVPGLGYAEFPQVSPDGKKVLFNVVGNYTTSQMFIMDKDGNNLKSLFTGESVTPESFSNLMKQCDGKTDEQGTWSHDGRHIFFRTNEKGTFGIAQYDVKTGERTLLIHDPNMNLKHPVETEDGYILGYGGLPGEKYKTSEKFSDIFIADPQKGTYKLLTHSDGSVAYKHPSEMDGMILAHKEPKGGETEYSDLVKIHPKTGEEINITNTPQADERHPFYNPKVDLIAYHSDETGDKNLWLMTPGGKHKCQLTFYRKAAQSPCWSPDGKKIYFVKKLENQPEGEPFYNRKADIRVIDVQDALQDLASQAKDRIKDLKSRGAEESLIEKAREGYDNYKHILKRYR